MPAGPMKTRDVVVIARGALLQCADALTQMTASLYSGACYSQQSAKQRIAVIEHGGHRVLGQHDDPRPCVTESLPSQFQIGGVAIDLRLHASDRQHSLGDALRGPADPHRNQDRDTQKHATHS